MKKKSVAALFGVLAVIASVFVAQPASAATGSWSPYAYSSLPSNWHCGPTDSGPKISAQSCIVRNGNYVQVATIVTNRTTSLVPVSVGQSMYNVNDVERTSGECPTSGVGPGAKAVCFTNTVTSGVQVSSSAIVSQGADWLALLSPWA